MKQLYLFSILGLISIPILAASVLTEKLSIDSESTTSPAAPPIQAAPIYPSSISTIPTTSNTINTQSTEPLPNTSTISVFTTPPTTSICTPPPITLFEGYSMETVPLNIQVTESIEWGRVDEGDKYQVSYWYFPIDFCRYKQIKINAPSIERTGEYASFAPDYQIGLYIIPVYEGHPENEMLPPVPSLTFYRASVYVISAETHEGSWEHFEVSPGSNITAEPNCPTGNCTGGAKDAPNNPNTLIPGGGCVLDHGVRRTEIDLKAGYYIGNQFPERYDDAVIADRVYYENKMGGQNTLTSEEYNPGNAGSAALSILKVVKAIDKPTFAFMSHGNNSIYKFRPLLQNDLQFYSQAMNSSLFVDNASIYFTDFFPKDKIIERMDFTSCCAANSTLDKNGKVAELLKKLTFPGSPIQMACGSTKQFMNHVTGFSRSKADKKYVKESINAAHVSFTYQENTWVCYQPSDSCINGWFQMQPAPTSPPDLQTYLSNSGSTPLDKRNCESRIKERCEWMISLSKVDEKSSGILQGVLPNDLYKTSIQTFCKSYLPQ